VCRYVGITSTFRRDYPAVEAVLERERSDFVEIDYSLDNRGAEKTILPLAAEIKAGVLTALPYGNGRLFWAVHGKELPDWARVFANSWAQFFLKYLLGDPRVTAVIRGPAIPATWRTMPARCAARYPIPINVVEWSNSSKRFDRRSICPD
jgi:predicted aldo/keto reductase-like oxidoreductase